MPNPIKTVVLTLEFENLEPDGDGYSEMEPIRVYLDPATTMTSDELSALGESVGQSDRWQVDNWIAIQNVLGGSSSEEELR